MRLMLIVLCLTGLSFHATAEDLADCVKGWDLTESGNYSGAIAAYDLCMGRGALSDASRARTYRNIGITFRRAKQPLRAVAAYDKAIAMKPVDIVNDYVNRANAYDEAGQPAKAMADYARAIEVDPDHGSIYYNRGVAYEHLKERNKARIDFIAAYNHGLRTRLLYERFVMYGLADEWL